ncbi:photosynthetic complex assembly protein PuhC [Sulfitobacter sabulilitoris]|uniref:Pullulanase n=1 Tax=Sulfitobacter sabulilitoris TaxID=2562655 RepID=A0A5S3PCR3_9RHOB|nr:photosynthetic complex assembly protein PuhC [Sulfitobacter sabulilitoris]TMM50555.1 pullulanase [Sulfitobacter sabulilitoris]
MTDTSTPRRPRIHAAEEELVPRFLVRLIFALLAMIVGLVAVSTMTDRPLQSTPPTAAVISERAILLSGEMSGAARVLDVNGTLLADLSPEKGGFVAGIERVIARERAKAGIDMAAPVLLQLRAGNRLSITDPVTGWSAELMGFGASNTRVFARLLDQP